MTINTRRLRALSLVLPVILLALTAEISNASESGTLGEVRDRVGGIVESELEAGGINAPAPAPDLSSTADENPRPWVGLPRIDGDGAGGEPCVAYRWVQVDEGQQQQAIEDAQLALSYVAGEGYEISIPDDCPVDPADELPPQMVRDAVREVVVDQLPRPEPEVPPGHAITGLPAYLVTHHTLDYGPVDHDVDLAGTALTVRVTGTATTTVDWGDGTDPVTYDQAGRPYPDGQVRHAYADKGSVDITLTDTWQLRFDVRRQGTTIITDTVTAELAPVTLDDLEIQEVRAVRTGPTG